MLQYRQPEVLCFCAPVKQRRTHFPFIAITKKAQPSSSAQGIYLGDRDETMTRRLSNVPAQIVNLPAYTDIPPPKPPRPYLAILSNLNKQKEDEEIKIISPQIASTSDTNQQQQQQQQQQQLSVKKSLNNLEMDRSCSIVRSISDYQTNDIPLIFTKSHTTAFDEKSPSLCKGMTELEDALNFTDDKSLSNAMNDAEMSAEKAPLVVLQEICSGISADNENISHNGHKIACESCHTIVHCDNSTVNTCKCNHHPVASRFKIIPTISTTHSGIGLPEFKQNIGDIAEEVISKPTNATIIRIQENTEPMNVFDPLENISEDYDAMQQQQSFVDPQEATYMDVAVIRCLLIKYWAENGVYWALKYLLNRLFEIKIYRNSQNITYRLHSRTNSMLNIPRLKLYSSKMVKENRKFLDKIQYRPLAWDDLQLGDVAKKLEENKFNMRQQNISSFRFSNKCYSLSSDSLLQTTALSRRNDMMISGSIDKTRSNRGHLEREKSDPSGTNSSDGLSTRDARSSSIIGLPKQVTNELCTSQFFPEAPGSTNFIEQNGQISFIILLKAINFAIERRSSVRIYELALNICESLLEMPETELQSFFDDCINIVLRTYLWLGCPYGCNDGLRSQQKYNAQMLIDTLHSVTGFCRCGVTGKHFFRTYLWLGCPYGCNDGLRSQQSDFLRIKARTILATISYTNPEIFRNLLINHIEEYNAQMLIDTLHSVTGFCRCGVTAGIHRTRSSSSPHHRTTVSDSSKPSYENNFNESLKGIEGIVIKVILKPVVSKLMNAMNELLQPENMSLYQDVRLFVAFIQEQHGNSFRRVGLSALLDGRPSENQSQFLDVGTSQLYSSRRTSLLCPLPEIFLSERKFANNDDNE
ncbi:hypothetical protein LOAG_18891 [Loa loa]|uniref:Uncharacterized protein n=1 Tax=Loa loa TaxID=7209 RepID=A0A1S0UDG0_LOALO|nr:hypothetical protein LOAG_18891 [Loa loa]EJD73700.1 hypothetical protein LOAG_18891 [Loa loa]